MSRLSVEQKEQFRKDGVLVVENVLTSADVEQAVRGLHRTLAKNGVHSPAVDDENSARAFQKLSSTNGSGGVLDVFYEDWKMEIATNPNLFQITTELWDATFCRQRNSSVWSHPFGSFDCEKGYMYIDRICYRLPTKSAEELGERINGDRKKKKARSMQRSLTPHLDCCPATFHQNAAKWRPIQCFVSLTDNLEANTGGFEAAKGFHHDFEHWTKHRKPTITITKESNSTNKIIETPPPCVGEYTHIRPVEDREVMERVCHLPVSAGSAVFWDNRIPHANAYRHDGCTPRAVVYCSFLPDVPLNRQYVKNQLQKFWEKRPVTDQWNHIGTDRYDRGNHDDTVNFTALGRKLMGIDSW
eukprot:scaffold22581_cov123-Cylindrotheca_fusiformis.AAC.15